MKKLVGVLALIFTFCVVVQAEEVNKIFDKVNQYITNENFPKALEELTWAQKEIEKMHVVKLSSFLPDQLSGLTGKKMQSNSALGMSVVERIYEGEGAKVKVSLTGGKTSGAAGAFGGLAAFGKMAAMMGNQQGMDSFRIEGRTATLKTDDYSSRVELSLFLDSGSILNFEMTKGSNKDKLKEMAQSIDVNGLDNYLRGINS